MGYPWITQLEQGATDWDTHIAFRVVVQTEETFNSVFLEKITFGDEGCCTKVASTREFDLRGFAEVFAIKGTLSGFEFVSWNSTTSFMFRIQKRTFRLSNIQNQKVEVEEIK